MAASAIVQACSAVKAGRNYSIKGVKRDTLYENQEITMKTNLLMCLVTAGILFVPVMAIGAEPGTCQNLAKLKVGDAVTLNGTRVVVRQMDITPVIQNKYSQRFVFDTFENPKLKKLRRQEQLDMIVAEAKTEFDRQVLLLDWVYRRIKKFGAPTSDAFGALEILEAVDKGHSFNCMYYGRLMVSAAAAMGWIDRAMGVRIGKITYGSGAPEHTITEIWSNQYCKWVMFDPTYAMYVEKDGVPLNAWEIRQEWFYGDADSLDFVIGAQRKKYKKKDMPVFIKHHPGFGDITLGPRSPGKLAFIGYVPNTNLMDAGIDYKNWFISKDKQQCEGIGWHTRDNPEDPATEPYFPLNQAAVTLTPGKGMTLDVKLDTFTPNFATYRWRIDQGSWQYAANGPVRWHLHRGSNGLEVISVNKFGVEGPPSRVVLNCATTGSASAPMSAESSDVLATLYRPHPRLMLKDEDLALLKERYQKDKTLQRYVRDVLCKADVYLAQPMLTYDKADGKRILHVSRECVNRTYAMGLAWRWTGKEKYAAKVVENLLAVCAFDNWNPSHFLDTAEMSHAVGIGYDWLFDYLDEQTRQQIKAGLIKNGLEPGIAAYANAWWVESEFNWNQVCNSGLLAGALAIAETDPEYAEFIVPAAVASLPTALQSYAPDGAWMEGPAYWGYATHYTAYGLAALDSALGTDFGLLKTPGLSNAGYFPIYTAGPTGLLLNFADSGEKSSIRPASCLFWLARVYNNPLFADTVHDMLTRHNAGVGHVIWYRPASAVAVQPKDLDRYFRGPVEIAVFRSAWNDPEAMFLGVKAGYNQVNHGNLDLGNFELDALGVRWARDLGRDNYNLPGYFSTYIPISERPDGIERARRWTYYRMRSASHSVPLLGGQDQDEFAKSEFIKYETKKSSAFVLVDLTQAYGQFAKKTTRAVALVQNRRAVLVQDEFEIEKPCEVVWAMTTDADIAIEAKTTATLTLDGKQLIATLLCPGDAAFTTASAEQKPPERPNTGVKRLLVRLPQAKGSVRIAVLLSPVWKDGISASTLKLKPLAEW